MTARTHRDRRPRPPSRRHPLASPPLAPRDTVLSARQRAHHAATAAPVAFHKEVVIATLLSHSTTLRTRLSLVTTPRAVATTLERAVTLVVLALQRISARREGIPTP